MPSRFVAFAALVFALGALPACVAAASFEGPTAPGQMTVAEMREELAPYGQWGQSPELGPVFRPSAGPDFVPYTSNGRWVSTDEGWAFESDDPWGDITYHYGRWFNDAQNGWVWVPDTVWGPSWVDWRETDTTVGWNVLPPLGWSYDAYGWTFVRTEYFVRPHVAAHVFVGADARAPYVASHPVARTQGRFGGTWSVGPSRARVEAVVGTAAPRASHSTGHGHGHGHGGSAHGGGHGHGGSHR